MCKSFSGEMNEIVEKSNDWIQFPKTVDEADLAKEAWGASSLSRPLLVVSI